jgi:hypothetical protein
VRRRRPVDITLSGRYKMFTMFLIVFCVSKRVETGMCFGFKQWLSLSIGNSFYCGLGGWGGHKFVTSFWKGDHIFDEM